MDLHWYITIIYVYKYICTCVFILNIYKLKKHIYWWYCILYLISIHVCLYFSRSVLAITLSYVVDKTESKHNCKTVKYDQKGEIATKANSLQWLFTVLYSEACGLIKDRRDGKGPLGHQTYPLTKEKEMNSSNLICWFQTRCRIERPCSCSWYIISWHWMPFIQKPEMNCLPPASWNHRIGFESWKVPEPSLLIL